MHILVVSSWYPYTQNDLTATFVREQAHALAKTDRHKIGVLFPYFSRGDSCGDNQPACCAKIITVEDEIPTYRMSVPRILNRIPLISAYVWNNAGHHLFKHYVAAHGRPDVIIAHAMFYAGVFAALIWQKYGIPYVILEHDSGYARGFVKPWQLALGKKAAASSHANLAVGQSFSELLARTYGMNEGSWRCQPNMVADEFFQAPLPARPTKCDIVYCSVCNLNPNKGIDNLIRAFAKVYSRQPGSRLIIGGDGSEKSVLQKLTIKLGIGHVVDFRGQLSRQAVVSLLSEAHVLVCSSYYETFGITLAEAHALGRPVVATDSGGPADIVRSENGLLVPVGDVDAIASAMLRFNHTAECYDPKVIRQGCKMRFSETVFVNAVEKILQDI